MKKGIMQLCKRKKERKEKKRKENLHLSHPLVGFFLSLFI